MFEDEPTSPAAAPAPWPMRSCSHLPPTEPEAAIAAVDFHPSLRGEMQNTYLRMCPACTGAVLSLIHACSEVP